MSDVLNDGFRYNRCFMSLGRFRDSMHGLANGGVMPYFPAILLWRMFRLSSKKTASTQ